MNEIAALNYGFTQARSLYQQIPSAKYYAEGAVWLAAVATANALLQLQLEQVRQIPESKFTIEIWQDEKGINVREEGTISPDAAKSLQRYFAVLAAPQNQAPRGNFANRPPEVNRFMNVAWEYLDKSLRDFDYPFFK